MRVLIITYYWPPSGGGGVQRWLKLSKYLPKEGVTPLVYTPYLRVYPHRDDSLLEDVPSELEIWRQSIWEPQQYFSKLLRSSQKAVLQQGFLPQPGLSYRERIGIWVRANLFVPDAKVCWLRSSFRFLRKKLRESPVDLVISTGPPHSMHLIAMKLQRCLGIRWWADFRDPWTDWEMILSLRPGWLAVRRHRRLEQRVLRSCERLITVSKHWAGKFQKKGARSPLVLYNGYDEADFPSSSIKEQLVSDDKFRLLHLGNLNARPTTYFWDALRYLCSTDEEIARRIEVVLGGVLDKEVETLISRDVLLRERVRCVGYVPHKEVFKYYLRASVLLLFSHISPNMSGQIPGKFFEYLAMRRPILALGKPKGELDELLQTQDAGLLVDYRNVSAIVDALRSIYKGESKFRYAAPTRFSRQKQASLLAKEMRKSL